MECSENNQLVLVWSDHLLWFLEHGFLNSYNIIFWIKRDLTAYDGENLDMDFP